MWFKKKNWLLGGGGWVAFNNQTGSSLLPAVLSSISIYQYMYKHDKIWKQSVKDFLSYRDNDEVSADATDEYIWYNDFILETLIDKHRPAIWQFWLPTSYLVFSQWNTL